MKNRLHLKDWDVLNKNSQLIIHPDVFMDITQERLLQILQDNPNHQITFFKEIIRQNQHKDKGTVDLIRISQLIIHPDVFMDITQERLLQILQDNPNHQTTFFKEIIRQNQHKDKGTVDLIRNSQLTIPFEGIPDVFSDIREVEQQIQQDVANYTAYSNVNVWDLVANHRKRIVELERECAELRESGARWSEALAEKVKKLMETRMQLKYMEALIENSQLTIPFEFTPDVLMYIIQQRQLQLIKLFDKIRCQYEEKERSRNSQLTIPFEFTPDVLMYIIQQRQLQLIKLFDKIRCQYEEKERSRNSQPTHITRVYSRCVFDVYSDITDDEQQIQQDVANYTAYSNVNVWDLVANHRKRIVELERECAELRESGARWSEALAEKVKKLMETRMQLKYMEALIENSQLTVPFEFTPDVLMYIIQQRQLQLIKLFDKIRCQYEEKERSRNSQPTHITRVYSRCVFDVYSDITDDEQQIQQDVANYTAYSNVNVWDLVANHRKRIVELERECAELRESGARWSEALAEKVKKLMETRMQLKYMEALIEKYKNNIEELEREISKSKNRTEELERENSDLIKEVWKQVQRADRQEETIHTLRDENTRQEETIHTLRDENTRQEETIHTLRKENTRYKVRNAKQKDEYCRLYSWRELHISLETPSETYISINPHRNTSLLRDNERLGENPNVIIPLFGLNVEAIDEWYNTIEVRNEQRTNDYSLVAAALIKGSDFFEGYFACCKDTTDRHLIYKAASEYTKKQRR
ncbi:myosin-16-like isoform X2 [Mya arenaria]|uniref:myosin-16-like isoform X2 n=1 Tax=Mya arenaria TaxID=6604 RepID=UPI0022E2A08E|nr:myosin-16-like isoform X2 [Mya arenaria]